MNKETIDALEAINQHFYRHRWREFSVTRQHPWPGWQLVLDAFRRHGRAVGGEHRGPIVDSPASFDVVDAGCGNGRFAKLLDLERAPGVRYLGVDASPALIAEARREARRRRGGGASWVAADLCMADPGGWSLGGRTGISRTVVAFGLFHHVASFARRRALLSNLVSALEPGGLLAVSFWQFGERQRFLRRAIPWDHYNRDAEAPIDVDQLEAGDFLLAWGDPEGESASLRYCHHATGEEAAALVSASDLEVLETFRADGRDGDLNLYFVVRRSRSI